MGTTESAVLIVHMLGTFELQIAQLLVDYFNILLAELQREPQCHHQMMYLGSIDPVYW